MNNPLGVSPSKGNQVTTRGKEKIFDLGGNRPFIFTCDRLFSLICFIFLILIHYLYM